jgi:hypothetical protein
MSSIRLYLSALVLVTGPLAAQSAKHDSLPVAPAPREAAEDEVKPFALQVGVAGGALSYEGGRQEQAVGAVVRWAATPWLALSATPTMVHVREPSALTVGAFDGRSGVVDLPLDATIEHAFPGRWSPGIAFALGVSVPLGDTASGFGAGKFGYSASAGVGFSPASRVWVHLGAGRSLTDVAMQSAFTSGNGWGDASAGVSVTDRFGVSGGYSSDIGTVDSTVGHSRSINGGFSYAVRGPTTINLNASHGVSGLAPKWSLAIGFGTAFPYLNHLGAGSPLGALSDTFGGGTHGLDGGTTGTGTGTGTGSGSSNGRGRGRKTL